MEDKEVGERKRKNQKRLTAYIDGSSKGLYGYWMDGKTHVVRDHPMTNNQAEWLALYYLLLDLPYYSECDVYSDSMLVVNQFNGDYQVKDEDLRRIYNSCKSLVVLKHLRVNLNWVPRKENKFGKILEKELAKERLRRWQLGEGENRQDPYSEQVY